MTKESPLDSSGRLLRIEVREPLEGFRRHRIVRVDRQHWTRNQLPPEERIRQRQHPLMVPVRFVTLLVILVAALAPSLGAEPDSEGVAFFERKIRPVLVKRCYECHSARAKKIGGKLLLDSREALLRGGESGPVLVVGKPESSRIIQALRWADELEMPPDDPLPGTVVHDFVEWVRRGAPDPRSRAAGGSDASESGAKDEAALWSFQPIADPRPPEVDNITWPRDPIDRFVLARLEARNFKPAEDASADVLIRRLYFGLVGLAPTFGEVEAFRADHARDARAATGSLVDDLLGRRAFGERGSCRCEQRGVNSEV